MGAIALEVSDGIATVTLDRPPVNAIDPAAIAEIRDVFRSLDDRRDVRAAVFTAVGERAFIAGVDLKSVGQPPAGVDERATLVTDPSRAARDAMWAITDCAVPVIGAINGPAIGAGLAFAACCDILLAAEHATFSAPEINVGLLGASVHLSMLVGRHKARELYFTGGPISAAELHRLGAVRAVVPREALDGAAREARGRARGEEPDRAAPREGGDEPRGAPAVEGRLPDRAGLHRVTARLRGRGRVAPRVPREAAPRVPLALNVAPPRR